MTNRTPDTPGQVMMTRGREMTLGNDQRTWSDSWKVERPTGRKLVGNDQDSPISKTCGNGTDTHLRDWVSRLTEVCAPCLLANRRPP